MNEYMKRLQLRCNIMESCLEIPKASLVCTPSERSGPERGGADVLTMPPRVEEVWEEHHTLWMSHQRNQEGSWPATPGKVYREVPSCPEVLELPLIAEPCLQPHSPAEGRSHCAGGRRGMGVQGRLPEKKASE